MKTHSLVVDMGVVRVGLLAASLALASCGKDEEDAPIVCGPETEEAPVELACTGLYEKFETGQLAATARPYAPGVPFWSDGYDKTRWIMLPEGKSIDASTFDDWTFPVGTKVWKEFRFGQQKIETRMLWKVTADRWVKAAYVWSENGKRAPRGEGKKLTVAGAEYQVPDPTACNDCHQGRQDVLLGFEAVSLGLPTATGLTLATLAQEQRLTPAPARTSVTLDPGAAVLHVNCGVTCHNSTPAAKRVTSTLRLRVGFDEAADKPVSAWELFKSTADVPATLPGWGGRPRVTPGAPEKSVVIESMTTRGTGQMPPQLREVDFAGVAAVETFVRSLPPR